MLSRRRFLAATAAVSLGAPAVLRAQPMRFAAWPFRLGVAAGDPTSDGMVLWTRLCPEPADVRGGMPMTPIAVSWEVATDKAFASIVASGEATAWPDLAHSVHVEVAGLQPDRPYFYRFHCGGERSDTGAARTLPAPGAAVGRIRFAVAGCQQYEDGLYTAWRRLAADPDLAFCYHFGDYIYENREYLSPTDRARAPAVRHHDAPECFSLDDYRRRYTLYKQDADLQAAHRALAMFPTFDDHEVQNDWTSNHGPAGTPPEIFLLRRASALQAWYEHMPVRARSMPHGGMIEMARSARIGTLLDLRLLDTRQFRTAQPCGGGFRPVCAGINDPGAQIIGGPAEQALAKALARPETRWTALAQQVMMMDLDRRTADAPSKIVNIDTWAGYAVPRARVLDHLGGRGDVVVLTGDEHQNFAGHLRDSRGRTVAVEFVSTSISSGGDGSDKRSGTDRILAENDCLTFMNDQRGFTVCEVTPDRWSTDFMVLDRVSSPGGTLSRRARFSMERGNPMLVQDA
ncbi:alkaline phosphatase D family protein [Sphingomonas quercus]|uniref:Alkaline phosphatase D family protein n=1 Tax=Sphingomonas quercus TaxID=2842451 RepID=A0ABS6BE38_9SPHN|nr:alkaline phosphatase D family protein [Sphingomonas quercus]MBU3076573.1 alkaline phosphatase D family protein [Sphingomonas quercus]